MEIPGLLKGHKDSTPLGLIGPKIIKLEAPSRSPIITDFRKYIYAKATIILGPIAIPQTIYLDSGYGLSCIDRNFLIS